MAKCCCCNASDDHAVQISADFPLVIADNVFSLKTGDGLQTTDGKGLQLKVDDSQFQFDADSGALQLNDDVSGRVPTVPPIAVVGNKVALQTTGDFKVTASGQLALNLTAQNPVNLSGGALALKYDDACFTVDQSGRLSISKSFVHTSATAPITYNNGTVGLAIGNGLEVNNRALAVKIGAGLTFNSGTIIVNAGNGIWVDNNVLNVRLGNGLTYGKSNAIKVQTTSPLTADANGLKIKAGDGVNTANGLSLKLGKGLEMVDGKLQVKIRNSGRLSFDVGDFLVADKKNKSTESEAPVS